MTFVRNTFAGLPAGSQKSLQAINPMRLYTTILIVGGS